jgi:hypothetical protein
MKKIAILAIAAAFTGGAALAQTTSFGFKVGINHNNLPLKAESGGTDFRLDGSSTGFHVGGVADFAFNPNFSIQPNLLLVLKGGTLSEGGKVPILAIDLPINFLYKTNGFFIGAGPNFSYGLSAKLKPWVDGDDETDLYEEQGGEEAPFNRFEIGSNVTLGYQFPSGLTIGANWTQGFSNVLNEDDLIGDDTKLNTRYFGLSIGYLFNKGGAKKK